jgi:hypothetical protein
MKRSIKRNGVESLMSCEDHNLSFLNSCFSLVSYPLRHSLPEERVARSEPAPLWCPVIGWFSSGGSVTIRADFGGGRRVGEEQGVTEFVAYSFLFCFGLTSQFPWCWLTGDFLTASFHLRSQSRTRVLMSAK